MPYRAPQAESWRRWGPRCRLCVPHTPGPAGTRLWTWSLWSWTRSEGAIEPASTQSDITEPKRAPTHFFTSPGWVAIVPAFPHLLLEGKVSQSRWLTASKASTFYNQISDSHFWRSHQIRKSMCFIGYRSVSFIPSNDTNMSNMSTFCNNLSLFHKQLKGEMSWFYSPRRLQNCVGTLT